MELLVKRAPAVDSAIIGDLYLDGVYAYKTLEHAGREIPAGRYAIALTVSQRATEGELWSPDPRFRLPLVRNVPGRSGIRLHAANEARELDGCLGVGLTQMGVTIRQSRIAVTQLMARLAKDRASWLTIQDPSTVQELKA